jgi:hypothetical protein
MCPVRFVTYVSGRSDFFQRDQREARKTKRASGWLRGRVLFEETGRRYCCETVCTTLESGRALTAGTFMSLTRRASYSGKVSSGSFAFI